MFLATTPTSAGVAMLATLLSFLVVGIARADGLSALTKSLRETEIEFARTMADRDHEAFVSFLDEESIFYAGDEELRGRDAVASAWRAYFEGEAPPFSWSPAIVTVLDSGTLGLTSGPVLDPDGRRFATFTSIWRRTPDGEWKIVLDRGQPWSE